MRQVEKSIRSRHTTRCYSDRVVDMGIVEDIIDAARWTPSFYNAQPWKVYAVTGNTLWQIKQAYKKQDLKSKNDSLALESSLLYMCSNGENPPSKIKSRISEFKRFLARRLGDTLFSYRQAYNNFYNAPMVLYITRPVEYDTFTDFDIGAFVNSFCLLAYEQGLYSIIDYELVGNLSFVMDMIKIPKCEEIIISIALGYEDKFNILNEIEPDRLPVSEIVTFLT